MFFKKRKGEKELKQEKEPLPKLYNETEIDALEEHITRHFSEIKSVFHEIVSPDIHADIAIIEPMEERNYYTLVTMGMGAHHMNVPPELSEYKLERADISRPSACCGHAGS